VLRGIGPTLAAQCVLWMGFQISRLLCDQGPSHKLLACDFCAVHQWLLVLPSRSLMDCQVFVLIQAPTAFGRLLLVTVPETMQQ
jgi:hypothetical protein